MSPFIEYDLLAGVAFIVSGIATLYVASRRRGDEPHCRSCDYCLKGIDSKKCPECGATVDDVRVLGRRMRSPGMIASGLFILLVGVFTLAVTVSRLDLYAFLGTRSLVTCLKDATRGPHAWHALERRMQRMSRSDHERLIQQSLKLAGTGLPVELALRRYLAERCTSGCLAATDAHELCSKLCEVSAVASPGRSESERLVRVSVRLVNSTCPRDPEQIERFLAHVSRITLCFKDGRRHELVKRGEVVQLGDAQVSGWHYRQDFPVLEGKTCEGHVEVDVDVKAILPNTNGDPKECCQTTIRKEFGSFLGED